VAGCAAAMRPLLFPIFQLVRSSPRSTPAVRSSQCTAPLVPSSSCASPVVRSSLTPYALLPYLVRFGSDAYDVTSPLFASISHVYASWPGLVCFDFACLCCSNFGDISVMRVC
jgi:hypothetical protein